MILHFVEATDSEKFNFGKFMLGRFTEEEWQYRSRIDPPYWLMERNGRSRAELLVVDTQTGEGAFFAPGRSLSAMSDLNDRHKIWVCPLFEPFLAWLYEQPEARWPADFTRLPSEIVLHNPNPAFSGYRRNGGK